MIFNSKEKYAAAAADDDEKARNTNNSVWTPITFSAAVYKKPCIFYMQSRSWKPRPQCIVGLLNNTADLSSLFAFKV